jgi:hypothetical protein
MAMLLHGPRRPVYLIGDVFVKYLLVKENVKGQRAVPLYLKVPLY